MDITKLENDEILYLYIIHKKVVNEFNHMINNKYYITPIFGYDAYSPLRDEDIEKLKQDINFKLSNKIIKTLFPIADIIASVDEYKYILDQFGITELKTYESF